MHIKMEREVLAKALGQLVMVVPTRSPNPVLSNILFEADGQWVTATATDMEVSLVIRVEAEVIQPGKVAIAAALLRGVVSECRGDSVEMATEGTKVRVWSGNADECDLPTMDAAQFPAVTVADANTTYVVAAKGLKSILAGTSFATDTENSRYALGGCLLEVVDGKLYSAATDGRRCAASGVACETFGDLGPFPTNVVVPDKGTSLFQRLAVEHDGDCQLSVDGNAVVLVAGTAMARVRMVEGRFPKWRALFESHPTYQIVLLVEEFRAAIRRAKLFTTNESQGVSVSLERGQLVVSKEESNRGKGRSVVPVTYDGEPIQIELNGNYLLEGLTAANSANVTMGVTDSDSGVFLFADPWKCVLMPMSRG